MSKYGKVVVNLSEHGYTSDVINQAAGRLGIGYSQAESLLKEKVYRLEYSKLRAKDPEVKGKMKEANRRRRELAKKLSATL